MDTASQLVRAKYAEVLSGDVPLQEFVSWLDAMPIPYALDTDFEPFLRLVIGARWRLMLWEAGAPENLVLASLQRHLQRIERSELVPGPDPLELYKLRFAHRSKLKTASLRREPW
jgi:hypothetical protein